MEKILAYLYLGIFLMGTLFYVKLLSDSNFEKMFKQGKVTTIRAAYIFTAFILSSITAWAITYLINIFYTILN